MRTDVRTRRLLEGVSTLVSALALLGRPIASGIQQLFVQLVRRTKVPATASADNSAVGLEANMSAETYAAAGAKAAQFGYPGGERLNVEPYDGYFSMAWTTTFSQEEIIRRIAPLIDGDTPAELMTAYAEGCTWLGPEPAKGVFKTLQDADVSIDFWRLDLDYHTLTWERCDSRLGSRGPGLLGYIADRFDDGYIMKLLSETGTPSIRANASDLVAYSASITRGAHVGPHDRV